MSLAEFFATNIGQKVRAQCPECGKKLKVQLQLLAEYEVNDTLYWDKTTKSWRGGNYEAGSFLSKLKDLKQDEGFGRLDIYCECGWFSEEG